jgi:hypothetical protein
MLLVTLGWSFFSSSTLKMSVLTGFRPPFVPSTLWKQHQASIATALIPRVLVEGRPALAKRYRGI